MMVFSSEARLRTVRIILCLMALGCIQVALGAEDTGRKLYRECCITRPSGHVDCGCYYCSDEASACGYGGSDEDEELTGGQIAGIVIVCLMILVGLPLGIWCCCRKCRQTDHAAHPIKPDQKAHVVAVPVGSATPIQQPTTKKIYTMPDGSTRTETTVSNPDGSKTTTVKVTNVMEENPAGDGNAGAEDRVGV